MPAFFADVLDLWILLEVALWALAIAATVTVAQRIWVVRRQALARAASDFSGAADVRAWCAAGKAETLVVDLSEVHPDLKHRRLRGKLAGNRLVPYHPRGDIDREAART